MSFQINRRLERAFGGARSVGKGCGMIGREMKELKKSSWDQHPEGYTGRAGFGLEIQHGACLTIPGILTSLNTTRVHLAYLNTGRVGPDGHFFSNVLQSWNL